MNLYFAYYDYCMYFCLAQRAHMYLALPYHKTSIYHVTSVLNPFFSDEIFQCAPATCCFSNISYCTLCNTRSFWGNHERLHASRNFVCPWNPDRKLRNGTAWCPDEKPCAIQNWCDRKMIFRTNHTDISVFPGGHFRVSEEHLATENFFSPPEDNIGTKNQQHAFLRIFLRVIQQPLLSKKCSGNICISSRIWKNRRSRWWFWTSFFRLGS